MYFPQSTILFFALLTSNGALSAPLDHRNLNEDTNNVRWVKRQNNEYCCTQPSALGNTGAKLAAYGQFASNLGNMFAAGHGNVRRNLAATAPVTIPNNNCMKATAGPCDPSKQLYSCASGPTALQCTLATAPGSAMQQTSSSGAGGSSMQQSTPAGAGGQGQGYGGQGQGGAPVGQVGSGGSNTAQPASEFGNNPQSAGYNAPQNGGQGSGSEYGDQGPSMGSSNGMTNEYSGQGGEGGDGSV